MMIVVIYGRHDKTKEIQDYSFCFIKIPDHLNLSHNDRVEIQYNRHGNIEVTLYSGDIYGRTLSNHFIPFVGLDPYHKNRYQYVFDRNGNCISHPARKHQQYAKIDMCDDKSFRLWAENAINISFLDRESNDYT